MDGAVPVPRRSRPRDGAWSGRPTLHASLGPRGHDDVRAMDFLVELLLQFVFEVLFEVLAELLLDLGVRGVARVLRSPLGRYATAALVGFGAGAWWGDYLSTAGRGHRPRLFWVSLALGTAFGVLAFARRRREGLRGSEPASRWERAFVPWTWPTFRLIGFAVLNFAIAAGIAVGFSPPVPG